MADVVGVRFREAGRIYYFDGSGFDLNVGTHVVVETSHGQEVGRVVVAPDQVVGSEIKEPLKPIVRLAEPDDLEKAGANKARAAEGLAVAKEKAAEHSLPMRLLSADYNLDGSQFTVYFSAEDRVDFRALVRDLSSAQGTRVQFLQVGERDRAKMVDGIGRCGMRLCCSSWLTAFPTISIKMAKEQDLTLNPSKISGACGRLLCCLVYEYDQYKELRGQLPRVGATLSTPAGVARVVGLSVLKQRVTLRLEETGVYHEMAADELRLQYGLAVRPVELIEQVEKPMFEEEERALSPLSTPPSVEIETAEGEAGRVAAPVPSGGSPQRARRRRRRRRRRGGGAGGPSAPSA